MFQIWGPALNDFMATLPFILGFPWKSASNAGDTGNSALIPGQENPLEEKMAMRFSILAWKIPGTQESGRLQSVGVAKSQAG